MNKDIGQKNAERGGAGVKLLIALVILLLIAHAGYNYVPVAYQGEQFKQDMQTSVIQGSLVPAGQAKPVEAVRDRLGKAMRSNDLPPGTFVEVKQVNNIVQARVYYTKDIPLLPFGVYNYQYTFDHIATPSGFLTE